MTLGGSQANPVPPEGGQLVFPAPLEEVDLDEQCRSRLVRQQPSSRGSSGDWPPNLTGRQILEGLLQGQREGRSLKGASRCRRVPGIFDALALLEPGSKPVRGPALSDNPLFEEMRES